MSLNSFFQFFVPKENRFYPFYTQQAEAINSASKLLHEMVIVTDSDRLDALRKEVKTFEKAGDEVLEEFYTQLNSSVLTPFVREDMHELAELMDNFLDRIDDCANIIITRRFLETDDWLTTMSENIMFSAENLNVIISDLQFITTGKGKEIARLCNEIKTMEHDCDELYGKYISELFTKNYNLVEIIKRKDLVQVLENTMNSAKYISDKIRSIHAKLC
ncbi:MAG: DUF47 family protein [Bacteroidales bacterium]|nr:DUF47 family protein [Bacteroidales bacterium]